VIFINQIIPRTIQGEGDRAGVPTTLIRFSGCNLRCDFCDTKYSWKIDKEKNRIIDSSNINNFIDEIKSYGMPNILITGGEPFIYANTDEFWKMINAFGHQLEIETNGSLLNLSNRELLSKYLLGKVNISPKLNKKFYGNIKHYEHLASNLNEFLRLYNCNDDQFILKFVYDVKREEELLQFLEDINYKHVWKNIFLMPLTPHEFNSFETFQEFLEIYHYNCRKTVEICTRLKVRYSPRLHIEIFRDDRNERI